MKSVPLLPVPPEDYSDAERTAWLRGWDDGSITGPNSRFVFCPYDDEAEANLYEAWEAGFEARGG